MHYRKSRSAFYQGRSIMRVEYRFEKSSDIYMKGESRQAITKAKYVFEQGGSVLNEGRSILKRHKQVFDKKDQNLISIYTK